MVSFLVVTAILVPCTEASECQVEASRDNSDVELEDALAKTALAVPCVEGGTAENKRKIVNW